MPSECDHGYETKSNGEKLVIPGAMTTRSTPAIRKSGQSKSRKTEAMTYAPSDARGAARFAASPTARWPMNRGARLSEPVTRHKRQDRRRHRDVGGGEPGRWLTRARALTAT